MFKFIFESALYWLKWNIIKQDKDKVSFDILVQIQHNIWKSYRVKLSIIFGIHTNLNSINVKWTDHSREYFLKFLANKAIHCTDGRISYVIGTVIFCDHFRRSKAGTISISQLRQGALHKILQWHNL